MSKIPVAAACGLFTLASFASLTSAQTRPEADLCAVVPGAQPLLPARLLDGMGTTDMPVTTKSDEARKFFNQGVSQIHSFWFLESERSFLQATALDPDMAMAYWGISVSAGGDYRPAFQLLRDPLDGGRAPGSNDSTAPKEIARSVGGAALSPAIRAREAIEKAMSLRDKVTPRERLYIEAEAARRNPQSKNKDADHIAGLRALVTAYPDDLEAKSILGLALLDGFESASKKPRTNTMEGLRLLEEVAAKDDNSFGAHHYLIHGWEGSTTPERAWHASKRYPELVPNIPHALHMPGHIYAQSDRIDDAIAAFAAAADNERSYMKADTLYPNGHHGHNVHFLIHALNLDGRYQDSMAQVAHLMNDFKETPRERRGNSQRVAWRQGYYALVKTLVRFERWSEILDGRTIPVYDRPEQNAWRLWAQGLAFAATDRRAEAQAAHKEMGALLPRLDASRRPLAIAHMELEATIAAHKGDRKKSRYLFAKAADLEAGLLYTEPPSYPRPVVEGWGHAALKLRDFTSAEKAYREAIAREPGGGRALFGLAAALRGLGRVADSEKAMDLARKAWDKADANLPQMAGSTRTAEVEPRD
ncbi:MAG: tetratricopeptide repeat protein [Vicinamibacteria bacterium]|nr:tetratricopeptide repeat protein [Vicinamibacteria bacterium]